MFSTTIQRVFSKVQIRSWNKSGNKPSLIDVGISSEYTFNLSNQNEPVPKDVVNVIVEEGVTRIKECTFQEREKLKSIIFPQSLQEIEDRALAHCTSLESIFIPKHVTNIGHFAYSKCVALHEVIFEEGSRLKSLGKNTFNCCKSLTSIIIPKSVTSLGKDICNSCYSLESAIFERGSQLEAIPRGCFAHCCLLKSVIIADTVTVIDHHAFYYCLKLASIYFSPRPLQQSVRIERNAFHGCSNLQYINIPKTADYVAHAFEGCEMFPLVLKSMDEYVILDSSTNERTPRADWFKDRYDSLPLHKLCYRSINDLTQKKLDSIRSNDPSLMQTDESGLTPLHILCSHSQATVAMIAQVYSKYPGAAKVVNAKNMTPWHMYLVAKGVISYKEFDAILNGISNYILKKEVGVSIIARSLVCDDVMLNSIHSLIDMGLDYDLFTITLVLHGFSSIDQECNRLNGTSGLYPFMAMSSSNQYNLCQVYDIAMQTIVHNIYRI